MNDRIRIGNRKDKLIKPIIEGDTFNEWKAAVAVSGMFADIDNNNSTGDDAGVSEIGTPLNKANLFTDATRNKLGLSGDKSVNDGLNKLADMAIKTYTCTKSDTTFTLTGSGDNIKFVATADYAEGDTFKVNGTSVTTVLQGSEDGLPDSFFKSGNVVQCFLNGASLNFKGGGSAKKTLHTAVVTQTQTITVPKGVTSMFIRLFGGGGGCSATTVAGGGGGHMFAGEVIVTPQTEILVTIGAGGARGANGGATTFGSLATVAGGSAAVGKAGGDGGSGGGGLPWDYGGNGSYGGGGGLGGNGGIYGGGGATADTNKGLGGTYGGRGAWRNHYDAQDGTATNAETIDPLTGRKVDYYGTGQRGLCTGNTSTTQQGGGGGFGGTGGNVPSGYGFGGGGGYGAKGGDVLSANNYSGGGGGYGDAGGDSVTINDVIYCGCGGGYSPSGYGRGGMGGNGNDGGGFAGIAILEWWA